MPGPPRRSPRRSRAGPAPPTGLTSRRDAISSSRARWGVGTARPGGCICCSSRRRSSPRRSSAPCCKVRSRSTRTPWRSCSAPTPSHGTSSTRGPRRYQLDVSPPYFIPAPVVPWSIGTMGAFIRLRTVVSDRRQLLDVGIAGPIAGLVVALPVLAIGLAMSHPPAAGSSLSGMLLGLDDGNAVLGDSILTFALRHLVSGSTPAIVLHPVAFAGWLGVFVTMLNLLPISQLDGGHILYSALPRWHARVAVGFWALIVALGVYWRGWLLWGTLVLVLSRGRLGHPPVLDGPRPLPRSRTLLAWIALILFLATFTPVPFRL